MNVPWPWWSSPSPSPLRSGPRTSRPVRSGTSATPVSTRATPTPAPAVASQPGPGLRASSWTSPVAGANPVSATAERLSSATARPRARSASTPAGETSAATPATMSSLARTVPPTDRTADAAAVAVSPWTTTEISARARARGGPLAAAVVNRTAPTAAPARTRFQIRFMIAPIWSLPQQGHDRSAVGVPPGRNPPRTVVRGSSAGGFRGRLQLPVSVPGPCGAHGRWSRFGWCQHTIWAGTFGPPIGTIAPANPGSRSGMLQ
jgi:hypothetical protein